MLTRVFQPVKTFKHKIASFRRFHTYAVSHVTRFNQSLLDFFGPVSARECCRISPPRFLAECCKRQLNQGSFVLLYFRLFTSSELY